MDIKKTNFYLGSQLIRTTIIFILIGAGNAYASTFNASFDVYNNPLLKIIDSSTGAVINSGPISAGFTSYDTITGTGSLVFDATLSTFFGAASLHSASFTTNSNGSMNIQGLIDFSKLGILNNNFFGTFVVESNYDNISDATFFTYSAIALAGSSYNGFLMTDGPFAGALFDFQLTSSFLAFVENPYPTYSAVPVPSAVWLFGSGLLGLVGLARRKS